MEFGKIKNFLSPERFKAPFPTTPLFFAITCQVQLAHDEISNTESLTEEKNTGKTSNFIYSVNKRDCSISTTREAWEKLAKLFCLISFITRCTKTIRWILDRFQVWNGQMLLRLNQNALHSQKGFYMLKGAQHFIFSRHSPVSKHHYKSLLLEVKWYSSSHWFKRPHWSHYSTKQDLLPLVPLLEVW